MKQPLLILACLWFLNSCTAHPTQESASKDTLKYLALGDSYTIGESVPSEDNFPHQLAAALNKKQVACSDPTIIARTGWRTDQLFSAVEKASLRDTFDLVTLLIGVNDEYQGKSVEFYEPQFSAMLTRAIQLAGKDPSKVWVFSIPDYGCTPFGKETRESTSKRIDAYNAVNERISKEMGVNYLNITEISRKALKDEALIAGDGLHPSAKMYAKWVEAFLGEFKK